METTIDERAWDAATAVRNAAMAACRQAAALPYEALCEDTVETSLLADVRRARCGRGFRSWPNAVVGRSLHHTTPLHGRGIHTAFGSPSAP